MGKALSAVYRSWPISLKTCRTFCPAHLKDSKNLFDSDSFRIYIKIVNVEEVIMKRKQTNPFPFRTDSDDMEWLKEKGARDCRSMNGVLRQLVKEARANDQQKPA